MGGYGAYVWPAYLTAAILLLALAIASLRGLARAKKQLARLQDSHET